ncbi:MAG: SRPBCC domain-containing protein [Hymenobacteraceae bacterium]|nr:SRPBCC domain-containing protein [Hymenobacteraceae bacterium]MDX5482756.1 SRPBCC domain-containing protein [Hymenobacteraceae bacterium]
MRRVEITIDINTSPAKVIQAFTDPVMLCAWWGVERSLIELESGGLYTLAWNITEHGFGFVSTGTIKNYRPDQLLELDKLVYLNPKFPLLGPMKMIISATPKDDKTTLYLCQSGYQHGPDWDWYYEAVKKAWPEVALTLKNYLEKL